jgi:hypothetical protein
MLNRDAAAQGFDALQILVGHGLAMVKEPVQAFERDLAIHFLRSGPHPLDHWAQKVRWTLPVCCHLYFCLSVVHCAL